MRYLIILILAGCATAPEPVRLVTPDEKECGAKAGEYTKAQYQKAEFDESGMVRAAPMSDEFLMWATVFERCMRDRRGYR